MSFYRYCPKCGDITCSQKEEKCDFCNEPYVTTNYESRPDDWRCGKNIYKEILEEYVKPNPLFDEELYNKRVGIEKSQQEATLNQMRMEKRQAQKANVPRCPTCGSTNVEKISTAKKAFGFAMVGLFSSNLGKTMHCKNCGYKW